MQCEGYLPTKVDEPKQYGVFTVIVKSVADFCNDIQLREVTLQRCNDLEPPRKILHFHYHKWPDHGCPRTTEPLRRLARAVAAHMQETSCGPPLVHCSAGICSSPITLPLQCLRCESGSPRSCLGAHGKSRAVSVSCTGLYLLVFMDKFCRVFFLVHFFALLAFLVICPSCGHTQ